MGNITSTIRDHRFPRSFWRRLCGASSENCAILNSQAFFDSPKLELNKDDPVPSRIGKGSAEREVSVS
jgi:hypothetical protein